MACGAQIAPGTIAGLAIDEGVSQLDFAQVACRGRVSVIHACLHAT
jgi:hypothetical protein